MIPDLYYWILIGWMWGLGSGVLWMFVEELVHCQARKPRNVILCALWPVALPGVVAFYVAFVQPRQKK